MLTVAAMLVRETAGDIRLAHVIVTTVTAPEVVVLREDDGTSDSREEEEEEEEEEGALGIRCVGGGGGDYRGVCGDEGERGEGRFMSTIPAPFLIKPHTLTW